MLQKILYLNLFRQHAASIHGFVGLWVGPFVCRRQKLSKASNWLRPWFYGSGSGILLIQNIVAANAGVGEGVLITLLL